MQYRVPAADCEPVATWLSTFARCVRERDYDAARHLFVADPSGFGTVAGTYAGIDALVDQQWSEVWERTSGFDFDLAAAQWAALGDGGTAWAPWSSARVNPEGLQAVRTGRATIVLVTEAGSLRGVHTHFSMDPGQPA